MRLARLHDIFKEIHLTGLFSPSHGVGAHRLSLSCTTVRTGSRDARNDHITLIVPQQRPMAQCTKDLSSSLDCLHLDTSKPKGKQRKLQTQEEFLEQKRQFQESGPKIDTEDWLYDETHLSKLSNDRKLDRVAMLHACEKAYFLKDYAKCLELVGRAEVLFGVSLDDKDANEVLRLEFLNAGKKTKKSCKVERHVMELLHIKEKCVAKCL